VVVKKPERRPERRPERKPERVVPPKPPAEVKPPPAEVKPPPAEPAGVTVAQLRARYTAVGVAVNRLEREKGKEVAAPFARRYFGIPVGDALRKPGLRREVMQKLDRLDRDIAAAM
jgi:hypothetical protein